MDAGLTGSRILALRKEHGWTQKELADRLHVTDKAVSKWERGLNFPDIALMDPLAKELGTTVLSLLGLEDATEETIVETITNVSVGETSRMRRMLRTWVVVGLLAAIFFLSVLVAGYVINNQRAKEIFINEAYFLLTDIADEISTLASGESTPPPGLHDDLIVLDVRCIIQNQRTNDRFQYVRPGIFEVIARNLDECDYSRSELLSLAADLQLTVSKLSDESGIAENHALTYNELNDILNAFYAKWSH